MVEPSDHPPGSWEARLDEALERPWVYLTVGVLFLGVFYLACILVK
ncbi:MAG: hypothetical protein ABFE07_28850 [Armatimonadia bacterium]